MLPLQETEPYLYDIYDIFNDILVLWLQLMIKIVAVI